MGRKQAKKAPPLQTEAMFHGNESMIQKMEPKAQSIDRVKGHGKSLPGGGIGPKSRK